MSGEVMRMCRLRLRWGGHVWDLRLRRLRSIDDANGYLPDAVFICGDAQDQHGIAIACRAGLTNYLNLDLE